MRPTIVYAILSAAHRADTLAQLVESLGDQPVVIHHDFSQQPDFAIDASNARFVTNPAQTGWAAWEMIESITRTIEFCGEHYDYDYLQLLSPVDLPVRPLAEFEACVAAGEHDVAVDTLPLDADEFVFMTFAYRALAAESSFAYRALWKLHEAYFGKSFETLNRAGLSVPVDCLRDASGRQALSARMAIAITRGYGALVRRTGSVRGMTPMHVGSAWFGATRAACEYFVDHARRADVQTRFSSIFCPPEMLIATAFAGSPFRIAPANHEIAAFEGARPVWLGIEDIPALQASGRYFARKFPDEPDAEVRRQILASISISNDTSCAA